MKAMIFAAGLGTRLRPLTDDRPKALVKYGDKTLLQMVIQRLVNHGFDDIIINVHHFADMIEHYLDINHNFGAKISFSDERDLLLDTGGGLKKAAWFFDNKPFLVHNVDIYTDLDLLKLYEANLRNKDLVTLAVKHRPTSRSLMFDKNMQLRGWINNITGETKPQSLKTENLIPLAYSGIHVVNPKIFNLIVEKGVFSIIDLYLRLSEEQKITGFLHDSDIWLDLGKKENLEKYN